MPSRIPHLPTVFQYLALLAVTVTGRGADTPICLTANDLSIATGKPSLVMMSHGSTHIPVWSLSGGTVGQSVAGLVGGLPAGCAAVKVEIVVTTTDPATSPEFTDAYRVHLSQMVDGASFSERNASGKPVQTALSAAPFHTRTIVLESYYSGKAPDTAVMVSAHQAPGADK